ncbi:MAG: hypothetical protein H6696_00610 [Deferribacteres bacterium]|nr:hypothetical protein [candidate division KSB1 bacterium]MCB9500407.1 hypothetical protein [Deferribacteres bacterium]
MKRMPVKLFAFTLVIATIFILAFKYIGPSLQERPENIVLGHQWADLLNEHQTFSANPPGDSALVRFYYADSSEENLKLLRDTYNLNSVAGNGSEIERILNLSKWVYELTGHANNPEFPKEINAFTLIHMATVEHATINCYMKTVILNEVFLSMGFYSRQTHLLPHSHEKDESHFITSVYSRTLEKWLWMDPDFGIYLTDEQGTILGYPEIRKRLISGALLVEHDLQTNQGVLSKLWDQFISWIEAADYQWYISKNIFKVRCQQESIFNQRSKPDKVYFELIPDGYQKELLNTSKMTERGKIIYINDDHLFWQAPSR